LRVLHLVTSVLTLSVEVVSTACLSRPRSWRKRAQWMMKD